MSSKRSSHVYEISIKQDEDGWLVATVKGLPGVHTQARSLADLEPRIMEAIMLYHEAEAPHGEKHQDVNSRASGGVTGHGRRKVEGTLTIEVPA